MNDVWLPRIICGGLIALALTCIGAACYCIALQSTIVGMVITTLLVIASNVVSGLLGYVASPRPEEKPTP